MDSDHEKQSLLTSECKIKKYKTKSCLWFNDQSTLDCHRSHHTSRYSLPPIGSVKKNIKQKFWIDLRLHKVTSKDPFWKPFF